MFAADHTGILLSILLVWAVVVATAVIAARRDGRAPADDVGVLWLIAMATYSTLPPLSWLVEGGYYDSSGSWRLQMLQPSAEEVSYLLDLGLAYTISFAVAYLAFARNAPQAVSAAFTRISGSKVAAAIAIIGIYKIAMLVVSAAGYIRTPTSYVDSYLAIQELPVAARQAIKIGSGFSAVAQMVVLVALLQRWPKYRGFVVLYVMMVLLSFDPEGARVVAVTGIISVAIAWHVLVRPIPARWWIIAGVVGLGVFFALGFRRRVGSWAGVGLFPSDGVGEFDALWANAIELLRARELHQVRLTDATRFGELWAFVPSQLLPFEKSSLSTWFVQTYHPEYEARGGGWAFGAIAQAVVGRGVAEAVVRGVLLGAASAWLLRWCRQTRAYWWQLPLYLYVLSTLFQSVRDTTFRQLNDLVQVALPALILVSLIAKILSRPTVRR